MRRAVAPVERDSVPAVSRTEGGDRLFRVMGSPGKTEAPRLLKGGEPVGASRRLGRAPAFSLAAKPVALIWRRVLGA